MNSGREKQRGSCRSDFPCLRLSVSFLITCLLAYLHAFLVLPFRLSLYGFPLLSFCRCVSSLAPFLLAAFPERTAPICSPKSSLDSLGRPLAPPDPTNKTHVMT